jgi:hypothetical protein
MKLYEIRRHKHFQDNLFYLQKITTGHWWLTPRVLTTQETEIRRIRVQSQPGQIIPKDPILKNPSQK